MVDYMHEWSPQRVHAKMCFTAKAAIVTFTPRQAAHLLPTMLAAAGTQCKCRAPSTSSNTLRSHHTRCHACLPACCPALLLLPAGMPMQQRRSRWCGRCSSLTWLSWTLRGRCWPRRRRAWWLPWGMTAWLLRSTLRRGGPQQTSGCSMARCGCGRTVCFAVNHNCCCVRLPSSFVTACLIE